MTYEKIEIFPALEKLVLPEGLRHDPIERFRDEYYFLSNMYPLNHGIMTEFGEVPTTEHAYQMGKFPLGSVFRDIVAAAEDGFMAKKIARRLVRDGAKTRDDWIQYKVLNMYCLNFAKFTRNPELGKLLIETGDRPLIEGNTWGDTFWGVDLLDPQKPGENHLGNILMIVRDRIIEGN